MIADDALPALALVHLGATWFMVGLIWFVQVVHYPLFARVGQDAFKRYERVHQSRTTLVVAPVMLIELVTGAALIAARPGEVLLLISGGLLLLAWVSTAFVQVPCHRALEREFNERVHRRLVVSNWIRTFAWTARAVLVGVWFLGIAS